VRAFAAAAVAGALLLAGCGGDARTAGGGTIVGETLTVHSLIPTTGQHAGAARDLVDGQKLALLESGGTVGRFKVNFVALDLGEGDLVAERVRQALRDTQMVAAIADLDSTTARVTIPMLNAGGILHVSPGATYGGFLAAQPGGPRDEPDRWHPARERSFAPVSPTDPAQAVAIARAARGPVAVEAEAGEANSALARAVRERVGDRLVEDPGAARTVVYVGDDAENAEGVVEALAREAPRARILLNEALLRTDLGSRLRPPVRRRVRFLSSAQPPDGELAAAFERHFGRCPGVYAGVGHRAMAGVLAALERAGRRANRRPAVIRAYFEDDPLAAAAVAPWFLATGRGCADDYEPVG
jgi:hypothetical protein